MQTVILAGGLATRMRPLTETIPKALLPVAGEPFISHQLRWLKKTGVSEVVLSVGYLGEQIEAYVGDGKRWGLPVKFVHEGGNLLGTLGALRLAADQGYLAEKFLVTYGDSYLPISFAEVAAAFNAVSVPALLCIYRNEGRWDTSNVEWAPGKPVFYDKQRRDPSRSFTYIDYGLMGLRRALLDDVPPGQKTDLADLLFRLSQSGNLAAFPVKTRFYEIGSPEGLRELEALLNASL